MPPRRQKGQAAVEKKAEALHELSISYMLLTDIHPNSYNPNRQNEHEFDLLCKSIQEDGFTQPIIVAEDLTIVDGEHRWRAAHSVGLERVPVVVVPMAAPQARIATLRHNRARGSEDIELATEVLRDLEKLGALDWAADSLDLSDVELQRLLDDIPAPEALARAEFSEAWMPGGDSAPAGGIREEQNEHEIVGATHSGHDAAREAELRLRQARSEEERVAIKRDRAVFRLNLVFTGLEGFVVRKALGQAPAQTILDWCLASPEGQAAQAQIDAENARADGAAVP